MSAKKILSSLLTAACLAATGTPAQAGLVLGSATLNTADDLTRIGYGSGGVYEFLDLPATGGSTVAGALSAFGAQGFRLANSAELSELFGAFGFAYLGPANAAEASVLSVTSTQAEDFTSYLGTTFAVNAAIGQFDDLAFGRSYACISVAACTPNSFVFNVDLGSDEIVGVFLVRDGNGSSVPEPATLLLTSLGLLGVGTLRRRRQGA